MSGLCGVEVVDENKMILFGRSAKIVARRITTTAIQYMDKTTRASLSLKTQYCYLVQTGLLRIGKDFLQELGSC